MKGGEGKGLWKRKEERNCIKGEGKKYEGLEKDKNGREREVGEQKKDRKGKKNVIRSGGKGNGK